MDIPKSEYFARQTTISEVGSRGLERLQSATVAIVGVGGVGCAAAIYLAKMGIGHLRIIDQDIVESTNLQRLHGVGTDQLYSPKAEAVRDSISAIHPWVQAEAVVETLRSENVSELLGKCDLVLDGLDNFRSRYIMNRHSRDTGIPYLFTSSVALQGHLGLFTPPQTSCLQCALPQVTDRPAESCEFLGTSPSIVGLVGAIAAEEASKFLLGIPSRLQSALLTIDMLGPDFLLIPVTKRDNCPGCSGREAQPIRKHAVAMLCGASTANVVPETNLHLDLDMLARSTLKENILAASTSVLVYRFRGRSVSLFRSGRLIVEGVRDESQALDLASEIWHSIATAAYS